VVYCGGLENRFGFTADGGSNPSLSASNVRMQESTSIVGILIWVVLVGGLFGWLWWAGHLKRFANYVVETREELRKCTWPSWDELKGSTLVVGVAIILLGVFTVAVDFIFTKVVLWLT
jgi:preprotein translocase subunit SecE